MNADNLSPRLKIVASLVPNQSKIADIGSDHAYLAINLIKNKIAESAIAGEVAKGPLNNSITEIKQQGLEKKIDARLGNGLAVIQPEDEIDVICIAGMGGQLIRQILQDGREKLTNIKRLVLQPNVGEYELRTWLIDNGFQITHEDIVQEDYHIYEIMVAVPGKQELSEMELTFGPHLMKNRNDVFNHKWQKELDRLQKIAENLKQHPQHGEEKLQKTLNDIKQIEEMFENEDKGIN